MSTTEAGRLTGSGEPEGGRRLGLSLQAVAEAARRLDELSCARAVGNAADAVHAAQKAGQPLGTITAAGIVIAPDGSIQLDLGSPATGYTAPEKLRGGAVDRRSDVFSLGVVLWEALVHARLFDGADDAAVNQAVLGRAIALPSELNANVPAELDAICKKALARDPLERYSSAKVMAAEIDAMLGEAGYPESNEQLAAYVARARAADGKSTSSKASQPISKTSPLPLPSVLPSTGATLPPPFSSRAGSQTLIGSPVRPQTSPLKSAKTEILGSLPGAPGVPEPEAAPAGTSPLATTAFLGSNGSAEPAIAAAPPAVAAPLPAAVPPVAAVAPVAAAAKPERSSLAATAFLGSNASAEPVPVAPPARSASITPGPAVPLAPPANVPASSAPVRSGSITPGPAAPLTQPAAPPSAPTLLAPPMGAPVAVPAPFGSDGPTKVAAPPPVAFAAPPPPIAPAIGAPPSAVPVAAGPVSFAPPEMPAPAPVYPPPPRSIAHAETMPTPHLASAAQPQLLSPPGMTVAPGSPPAALQSADANPADAVALPRGERASTGSRDVLAGWGWTTGSLAVIDDGEHFEDPERAARKRLVIAIGGALVVILLIVLAAYAFSGAKPANQSAADKPSATAASLTASSAAPSQATPSAPEPSAAGSSESAPAAASPPASEPAAGQPAAIAPADVSQPAASASAPGSAAAPAVEAAKPADATGSASQPAAPPAPASDTKGAAAAPPVAQPAKPEPPKAAAPAALVAEPKPEAKKPEPRPEPKPADKPRHVDKPARVAAKQPVDPYAERARPDPTATYRVGLQQYARGDISGALTSFRAAVTVNPNFAPAWRGLGLVYERLGNRGQARQAFRHYIQLAPGAPDVDQIRDRMERLGS